MQVLVPILSSFFVLQVAIASPARGGADIPEIWPKPPGTVCTGCDTQARKGADIPEIWLKPPGTVCTGCDTHPKPCCPDFKNDPSFDVDGLPKLIIYRSPMLFCSSSFFK
ncbi:hypothetical protein PGT21_025959 [Puccinia graminis f. sp. tritici]|uniref:Uncharacterized protein n=1 Tax=Puccinia graminis f. sp. tritici TaxID=56615 RepID=A0A5B0M707_PUCGR|nr:hypothetical protein PGTUg99_027615 [Puccinia graminis f. sp. tritici]KAA1072019.1 hypothetical protein PGT21_025959 [Puccinia graminis f. sp. tritici]